MFRYFSKFVLWLAGWKINDLMPEGVKKAVITAGPHTSNLDFFVGRMAYAAQGVKVKFMIKKEAFSWPFGALLKALGGIPVDRSRRNNLVKDVAKLFDEADSLFVVIAPEGTRKPNPRWKKGFYYIAYEAKVPIALGYIDYGKKTGGVSRLFIPTGDIENDMIEIKKFYQGVTARHPEKFQTGL